jgi:hypothetical protein
LLLKKWDHMRNGGHFFGIQLAAERWVKKHSPKMVNSLGYRTMLLRQGRLLWEGCCRNQMILCRNTALK